MKKTPPLVFLEGRRVILRPLLESDYGPTYLGWLNDPGINAFSQKRPFPSGWEAMARYNESLAANPLSGFNLAIVTKSDNRHIGNIALVNVQPVNRCAEIAILIGDRGCWNQGYGAECIYLLTGHAFEAMNLHKVFAGSFNPAFVRTVEKLGWVKEGEFRDRIWSGGRYHSQIWMSVLRPEFKRLSTYEDNEP